MIAQATVVIFGATGFVGTAVSDALKHRGAKVIRVRSPRLHPTSESGVREALMQPRLVSELAAKLRGADSVVNAAGVADAASGDEGLLMAANAILPGIIAQAARAAGVPRMVHVSSAAVQGRKALLDSTPETQPFSAYSRSKALGEQLALDFGPLTTVIYRPAGVHGPDRRVTQFIARIARSKLASVASPGDGQTPQALAINVGDAIAFLAVTDQEPPRIVSHPSEGITTSELQMLLGGHQPRVIPASLCRAMLFAGSVSGRMSTRASANARRLEMLWCGQRQAPSWLTDAGWHPPKGRESWIEMGRQLGDLDSPSGHSHALSAVSVTASSVSADGVAASLGNVYLIATVWEQIRVQYPVHLELLRQHGATVHTFHSGGSGDSQNKHHPIPLSRGMSPLSLLRASNAIRRASRHDRPSMIIYGSPVAAFAGALGSCTTIPRRIFVVHGLREETLTGLRKVITVLLSFITAALSTDVVFTSDSTAHRAGFLITERVRRRAVVAPCGFVGVDPMRVASEGGDSTRTSIRDQLGLSASDILVGFTGRLAADKGIAELVAATHRVQESRPNVKLLLVGGVDVADPPPRATLDEIESESGILSTGHVDDPLSWYAAMDIFCLPSYREGLPTVAIEAAIAGIPLVLTNVTGNIDVADPNLVHFCSPASPTQLATSIENAITDKSRSTKTTKMRDAAVSRYSTSAVREWWQNFYLKSPR